MRLGARGGGGVIRLVIAAPSAVVRAGLEALAASSPELQLVGSFRRRSERRRSAAGRYPRVRDAGTRS